MERSLVWSALALGCVGWLCGFLVTRARRGDRTAEAVVALPLLRTALVLPLLVFLVTLPGRAPFAEGQGWGRGFLLGGLCALLTLWLLRGARPTAQEPLRAAALAAAPFALAVAVVALPLLWMRPYVYEALTGIAMGWLVVTLLLWLGLKTNDSRSPERPFAALLLAGAGFATTLCAVASMGLYRDLVTRDVPNGMWSAIALVFAAAIPFVMLVSALPAAFFARQALKLPFAGALARPLGRLFPDEEARAVGVRAWRLLLMLLLLAVLGKLLAVKAVVQPRLFLVLLAGLLAGLLVWWVVAEETRADDEAARESPFPAGFWLAALVMLCAFMVASQLMQGFGVGLMLLAAWTAPGLALPVALERRAEGAPSPAVGALLRMLAFGALLLLYRLYATRYENSLDGVTLSDHYDLFGLLVGAALPMALIGLLPRRADGPAPGVVGRLVLAGAMTLAVPGAILLLWGGKCAIALMAGLALASLGSRGESRVESRESKGAERATQPSALSPQPSALAHDSRLPTHDSRLLPLLFALLTAWALIQWSGHVLAWAEMARAQKIRLLAEIIAGLVALMLAADYGGRIAGWMRRRQGRAVSTPGEGAPR